MFLGKKPRIYAENATDYTNNGKGYLTDAQTCKVTEKLNGGLELEIQYPISGINYESIKINAIIYSPVNPYDAWQPFRIYNISRPQNGIVKVNAEHKCYELSGYPCLPNDSYIETAGSASQCMAYLESEAARTASALGNPAYTFETDILTSARWSIDSPTDIWSVMALAARWYNGEWKYDGTVCRLCAKRGEDRHVKVQYGSNLSTLTQDEIDTSYTHVMPYWTDGTTTVYITGLYMSAPNTESRMQKKVQILNLSSEFDSQPTEQELETAAIAWMTENPPKGIQKSLKVTFVARGQTIEGASLGDIDHVELGDTINVSSNPLSVNSTLRCITLVYDVLRGVYSNAELGIVKSSLATATMTVNERSEATVWVSTTEPTEGYKSGDYWIKIDNNTTRVAQALGRYTGGNWLLLCEYGGGTGKFLDSGHTSVAHHDTEHNTSTCIYDSIDGYKNSSSGTSRITDDVVYNGVNTIIGEHNTLTNGTAMFVRGKENTVTNAGYSDVGGDGNTVTNVNTCDVHGCENQVTNAGFTTVRGDDITVEHVGWAVVFGKGHSVEGDGYDCGLFVSGKGATVTGHNLMFVVANSGNIFTIDTSGNVTASGTITPGGADYAEFFEWLDGNPDNEDRRGMLVNLSGDKIVPAHGDDFIGVISANPSVIGNNAEMHWHGKYKTDVFGCVLKDEAGKPIISEEYKKQQYKPRSERPEWGLVGLVGRLIVTDDGSCKVGGYISARNGVATSCYTGNARVLRRIDDKHIEVLLK